MKVQIPRVEIQPAGGICTIFCAGCQHGSPQRTDGPIPADAIRPHLAALHEFAEWPYTFVGGGEPFLHPDLAGFLDGIVGSWHKQFHLITNGYWLLRKNWYDFARPALSHVSALVVSRYPTYVERLGVAEWDRRLDMIRSGLGLTITSFHGGDPGSLTFDQNGYHKAPRPIASPNPCAMKFCFQLLPDGRLAKCPLGRWLDKIPNATPEFRESYAGYSFYDLRRAGEGFAEWAAPDAHPACHLCGIGTGDSWPVRWSSDPRIRTATGDEYLTLIGANIAPARANPSS